MFLEHNREKLDINFMKSSLSNLQILETKK